MSTSETWENSCCRCGPDIQVNPYPGKRACHLSCGPCLYPDNPNCTACEIVGHCEEALRYLKSLESNGAKSGCFFKGQLSGEETLYHTLQFVNGEQKIVKTMGDDKYVDYMKKVNSKSPCIKKQKVNASLNCGLKTQGQVNILKKKTIGILTLLLFSLVSLNLSTTLAAQQGFKARFSSYALGECAILLGGTLGPSPPKEAYMGRGIMSLSGAASVDEYPPNPNIPHTYYVAFDGVKANGKVYAEWNDHFMNVFLYSSEKTNSFYVDEGDMSNIFTVGWFPGSTDTPSMSFKGIYKDRGGLHFISGKVGVLVFPVGPSATLLMGATFYKPNNTPLLTLLWVPSNQNLGPLGTIHASNLFKHSVNIINLS